MSSGLACITEALWSWAQESEGPLKSKAPGQAQGELLSKKRRDPSFCFSNPRGCEHLNSSCHPRGIRISPPGIKCPVRSGMPGYAQNRGF